MIKLLQGDWIEVLNTLPDKSVHTCVTSPPYYGLRSYLPEGHPLKPLELGQEKTPEEYVTKLVAGFREVRRVLRDDGTLWVNLGDSYFSQGGSRASCVNTLTGQGARREAELDKSRKIPTGFKAKDLVGIPWMAAFALRKDGWYLRSDIIWHKPNPMPEPVEDRPTKAHEYIFLMSKKEKYFYDAEAIKEKGVIPEGTLAAKGSEKRWNAEGVNSRPPQYKVYDGLRNKRSVWTVCTMPCPCPEAHFATFPPDLIKPCILAGCPVGGAILDPFGGSGTTGEVALELGRNAILIELNPEYTEMQEQRTNITPGLALC